MATRSNSPEWERMRRNYKALHDSVEQLTLTWAEALADQRKKQEEAKIRLERIRQATEEWERETRQQLREYRRRRDERRRSREDPLSDEKKGNPEKYYKLDNWRCPAKECLNSKPLSWLCSIDKSPVFLSQKGNIRCAAKYRHKGLMCEWKWVCSNHGEMEWRKADVEGFSWALASALQVMNRAGAKWVSELTLEIGKQFK